MADTRYIRTANGMRWAGRVIATVTAVFFAAMLIGSATGESIGPLNVETGTLVFLGIIALVAGIMSWWKDVPAGVLLLLTSVGMGIHIGFYAGRNHVLAWSILGLPYLVACLLMIGSWRISSKNR